MRNAFSRLHYPVDVIVSLDIESYCTTIVDIQTDRLAFVSVPFGFEPLNLKFLHGSQGIASDTPP